MAVLNQIQTRAIPLSKTKYTKHTVYQLDSPVQMVGYFIFKEVDANNIITQKKISFGFKNESDKKITAIKGVFHQKDPFEDVLGTLNYSLIELEQFTTGSIQGETLFMDCHLSTTTIVFEIHHVIFEDGSKWVSEQVQYISMDIEKKTIQGSDLNAMTYAWSIETKGFQIKNYYSENEHFYACPCGSINPKNRVACSMCKTPKEQAKDFETVEVAKALILRMEKEVYNKFNEAFPAAIVSVSSGEMRFNENAVLFDANPLKKLRDFATFWKGIHPLVKDQIKSSSHFVKFIEEIRNKLLKEENEKKLKVQKEKRDKERKSRIKLLTYTILGILAIALIGIGIYVGIFGKLAFETRFTYEAEVTFTRLDYTNTQIEIEIRDIDFRNSNFEFYGIVFDMNTCDRSYCYEEIILSPAYWTIEITGNTFKATIEVNMPMSGMILDIQYLEFNSQYFTKHIFVAQNKITYIT